MEEREAADEGPKLTKFEIEEITKKNEMQVNEDDPTNALGLGFKLYYLNCLIIGMKEWKSYYELKISAGSESEL